MKNLKALDFILAVVTVVLFSIDAINADANIAGVIGVDLLAKIAGIATIIKLVGTQIKSLTFTEVVELVNENQDTNTFARGIETPRNFMTVEDVKDWKSNR